MNDPSSIIVSLEKAKELEAHGWPQGEVLHYWVEHNWKVPTGRVETTGAPPEFKVYQTTECVRSEDSQRFSGTRFAAPTAEEILRRLPCDLPQDGEDLPERDLFITSNENSSLHKPAYEWIVAYRDLSSDCGCNYEMETDEDSLADAAASMWVFLKSHNLFPNE